MAWGSATAVGPVVAGGGVCCTTLVDGIVLGTTAPAAVCSGRLVDGISWGPAPSVSGAGPAGAVCSRAAAGPVAAAVCCGGVVDGIVLDITCWGGAAAAGSVVAGGVCCAKFIDGVVLLGMAWGGTAAGRPAAAGVALLVTAVVAECGDGVLGDALGAPSNVRGDLHTLHRSPSRSTSAGW